jgi:ADP-ribosylglycohydrolase
MKKSAIKRKRITIDDFIKFNKHKIKLLESETMTDETMQEFCFLNGIVYASRLIKREGLK